MVIIIFYKIKLRQRRVIAKSKSVCKSVASARSLIQTNLDVVATVAAKKRKKNEINA